MTTCARSGSRSARLRMRGDQLVAVLEQQLGEVVREPAVHLLADDDVVGDRDRRHRGRRRPDTCRPGSRRPRRRRRSAPAAAVANALTSSIVTGLARARSETALVGSPPDQKNASSAPLSSAAADSATPSCSRLMSLRESMRASAEDALGDDLRARAPGEPTLTRLPLRSDERADAGALQRDHLHVAAVDLGQRRERHRLVERLAALDRVERGVAERERDVGLAVAQPHQVLDGARAPLSAGPEARRGARR